MKPKVDPKPDQKIDLAEAKKYLKHAKPKVDPKPNQEVEVNPYSEAK